jgi:hypothetical protein
MGKAGQPDEDGESRMEDGKKPWRREFIKSSMNLKKLNQIKLN